MSACHGSTARAATARIAGPVGKPSVRRSQTPDTRWMERLPDTGSPIPISSAISRMA